MSSKQFKKAGVIMNVCLLHVAADTTNPGVVGPIFSDGSFEFIPIKNVFGLEARTYADFPARNKQYSNTLRDLLPSYVAALHPHPDPDFNSYTYGEPNNPEMRPGVLRMLKPGDILFFVSSLAPYDPVVYKARDTMLTLHQRGKKNKYVVGFFTVKGVVQVYAVKSVPKLSLALLNLLTLLEEGEAPIELKDLMSELQILQDMGYVSKTENTYELTDEGGRTAQGLSEAWGMQKNEDEITKFLEQGLFSIEPITGSVSEDVIKANHHFKRLRPVDWDAFIVVAGDSERSALLTHAVRLTEHFERFSFKLNQLGQTILKRNLDTLRGVRWLDEDVGRLLAEAIAKTNPNLTFDLPSCF